MSASLVGSEMCIRDRFCTIPGWHVSNIFEDVLHDDLLGVRALAVGRPEAVSYTHLTLPTICSV
eukprot:12562275-Alexandrium_andersonii.AAC.1